MHIEATRNSHSVLFLAANEKPHANHHTRLALIKHVGQMQRQRKRVIFGYWSGIAFFHIPVPQKGTRGELGNDHFGKHDGRTLRPKERSETLALVGKDPRAASTGRYRTTILSPRSSHSLSPKRSSRVGRKFAPNLNL